MKSSICITPLTPQEASPLRLLELVRGHWSIENSSHYVRDVTFGEDRSHLRSGQGPQIMAAFRNLAITLIHRLLFSHQSNATPFRLLPSAALALLGFLKGGQQSFTSPDLRSLRMVNRAVWVRFILCIG